MNASSSSGSTSRPASRHGLPLVEGRRLDTERAEVDVALTAMVDLVVDRVEQEVVYTFPGYWPKAVIVSWNRSAGICGHR